MKTISMVLDLFVAIAAVAAYFTSPRIGGQLVKGLQKVMSGILVLGLSHLLEMLLPLLFNIDPMLNDIIHGLLEGCALILLIVGFTRMRLAFHV